MDTKKISFGFSKIVKRTIHKSKEKAKSTVELIKCLEGQEIKLVEEQKKDAAMVIPLKENTKTSAALASLIRRRAVLLDEADEPPPEQSEPKVQIDKVNGTNGNPISESLEERAARELLASVQGISTEAIDQNLVLPALKADELPLDGAKQSSIDDYENVPIEQFGKAMLRGMGWIEPVQKKGGPPEEEITFVRPKGMGLGADKAIKKQPLLVAPEKNEVLEIKKQAFVRVLGGKHKDLYGQIEGFDDHAGRVIVKMAIGGAKEAFNEFLCQPVSKKEFAQYGKCINTTKYEEYKKMENEHGQIIIKTEKSEKKPSLFKESKIKDENEKMGSGRHRERRRNDDDKQRTEYPSSSRRHGNDGHRSYSSNSSHMEDDRKRDDGRSSHSRPFELYEQRSSSSRRERFDERRNERDLSKRRSRERTNRTDNEQRLQSASGSNRRQQYTDDTSASSVTDSDSDSAYERKSKKKSSHKSKAKKKSSKKSKRKHRHRSADSEASSSNQSEAYEDSQRREKKQHKKKTKKSKKPRSRSGSHDRSDRR